MLLPQLAVLRRHIVRGLGAREHNARELAGLWRGVGSGTLLLLWHSSVTWRFPRRVRSQSVEGRLGGWLRAVQARKQRVLKRHGLGARPTTTSWKRGQFKGHKAWRRRPLSRRWQRSTHSSWPWTRPSWHNTYGEAVCARAAG